MINHMETSLYPAADARYVDMADFVADGHGSWFFVTERGVKVEIGHSTHRPGYGVSYGTYTYGR